MSDTFCNYWTDTIPPGAVSAQRWFCQLEADHKGQHEMGLASPACMMESTTQDELRKDAVKMVNEIFEGDSQWLKTMCEEEIKQRGL